MMKVRITIKGSQTVPDGDTETFELVTDGEYIRREDGAELSYVESELTGYDGLTTTFFVEPEKITLSRAGGATGDMVFSTVQKHHFLFDTGFGSITMGVGTRDVHTEFQGDGGRMVIRYDIDMNNAIVSRNEFEISFTRDEGNIWQS